MTFYSLDGKAIKSIDLSTEGKGSINLEAYNLISGQYTYQLKANGKVIDTKKMIIQ